MNNCKCANHQGFSLHAGVHCAAEDRKGIEKLARYITRPAISNERLSINRDGNAVLTPMEFMQWLAVLVPRPRLHLIRFHGVLAPNAKLRSQVVPIPAPQTTAGEGDCTHALGDGVSRPLFQPREVIASGPAPPP